MSMLGYKNVFDTILFACFIGLRFTNGAPPVLFKAAAIVLVCRAFYEFCRDIAESFPKEDKEQEE